MANTSDRKKDIHFPVRIGKDEMNLVENPIAILTDRPDKETKTIKHTRHIEDRGRIIESNWIVTGSNEFGLPIAGDEDIYLILLELTKETGFTNRTLSFSRYELLRRLKGGSNRINGADYERLSNALNRLVGITIYADRWFDKSTGNYASYSFHLLEKVMLQDEKPGRKRSGQVPLRLSFAIWDETIFRNFQNGNLKNLDLNFYFSLSSPIAKRLYRFLDKRFFDGKQKYEMNIRELAYGHIGLVGHYQYDSKIKEKMQTAHNELVKKGYLEKVEFRKGRDGLIVSYYLEKRGLPLTTTISDNPISAEPELLSPAETLISYGISAIVAQRLVSQAGEEKVREKIAFLPFGHVDKNQAGWLRKAIEEDWAAPQGYIEEKIRGEERKKRQQKIKQHRIAQDENKENLHRKLEMLNNDEMEALRSRAEDRVRQKHSKAAQLADQGKGLRAWGKLIQEELERLVLGEETSN